MNEIYFRVVDDIVIKYTPMPEIGENTYKTEIVMTKEIFQECYKKWVEPQKKQCADCKHYGKLSLDCGRCDDDCSMFEPQKRSEE